MSGSGLGEEEYSSRFAKEVTAKYDTDDIRRTAGGCSSSSLITGSEDVEVSC
jgi:hypothetical protein